MNTVINSGHTLLQNIKNLVMQPNYPCISAINSVQKDEYLVSTYPEFGSGRCAGQLYKDLIHFKNEQRRLKASNYSFWAIYDSSVVSSEDDFEHKLWI